jgi:hypothetical protein
VGRRSALVLAGAGTSKTTVVVERVRHLLTTASQAPARSASWSSPTTSAAENMGASSEALGWNARAACGCTTSTASAIDSCATPAELA